MPWKSRTSLIEAEGASPKPIESNRSHFLKRGQILKVGMVEGSSTAYLAVAGGFALPAFMNSLSTYARAGVGGLDGRKLAEDDLLPLAWPQAPPGEDRKLDQPFDYGAGPIRIVWGPQDDYFSEAGRRTFVESTRAADSRREVDSPSGIRVSACRLLPKCFAAIRMCR